MHATQLVSALVNINENQRINAIITETETERFIPLMFLFRSVFFPVFVALLS